MSNFTSSWKMAMLFTNVFANYLYAVLAKESSVKCKNLPLHRGGSESYSPLLVHLMFTFPTMVYPVLHVKCIVCWYSGFLSLSHECSPFFTSVGLEQVTTAKKRKKKYCCFRFKLFSSTSFQPTTCCQAVSF